MSFEAVPRPTSLSDLAYERLREAILTGSLEAGRRFSIVVIAKQFAMSRSPVRAAVERLVAEGLMMVSPASGVEVAPLNHLDLIQVLQVRSRLEGLAARLAATRLDEGALARLREAQHAFDKALKAESTLEARKIDLAFHETIQAHSGNSILVEECSRVQARGMLAAYTTAWVTTHRSATDEHQAIITALEARNPEASEEAARQHLENLIDRVRIHFTVSADGASSDVSQPNVVRS